MRSLMFVAMLALPGIALGQSKPVVVQVELDGEKPAASKSSDTDRKLAQIEERLQAMIKEIQALRTGNTPAKGVYKIQNKTSEGESKRAVVRVAQPAKAGEKSEAKGTFWQFAPAAEGQGQKGEPGRIVLRLEEGAGEKGGAGKIVGTFDFDGSANARQAQRAEKGAKQAHEGGPIEIQGKVLIVGEDGKPLPQGAFGIREVEVKPTGPTHSYGVAGQKHEDKVIIARVIEGKDGKFVVETVEEKPGEKKVLVFGEEKKPANVDKVVKNVQNFFYEQVDKAAGESRTVNLTRATYAMPQAQARALASFLNENAKVPVLETKVDGDKLVVTTTPDVQHTVGQVVALISGRTVHATTQLRLSEATLPQYHLEVKPKQKPNPNYSDKDD